MPTSIRLTAQFIFAANLKAPAVAGRFLTALEGATETSPTHWGTARGLRDPYDRAALLAALEAEGPGGIVPQVIRTRPPLRYRAQWFGDERYPSFCSFQLESKDYLPADFVGPLLGTLDQLAASTPLEWGHVDLDFDGILPEQRMQPEGSLVHLGYHMRFGLPSLFARNYIGPRILELSSPLLEILPTLADATILTNSAYRFDLLPEPWNRQPSELKGAQVEALHRLEPTGVFARPAPGDAIDLPGPHWLPPGIPPAH